MTFKEIKETISENRDTAHNEALTDYSCVRSRGAWVTALKDGEVITESDAYRITTAKQLKADVAHLKAEGADEFYIDGGFDGADSVSELCDGYDPFVSEWSFAINL